MIVAGSVTRVGFEAALVAARRSDTTPELSGLSAPLDGGLRGMVSEVWDTVERALREAFVNGADAAKSTLDSAIANAQNLIATAGNKARDVHEALLSRIHTYLAALLDDAIARVRPTVSIGDRTLQLDGIDLSNKISLTGAIKIALTDILNMTATGEVTVVAHYSSAS